LNNLTKRKSHMPLTVLLAVLLLIVLTSCATASGTKNADSVFTQRTEMDLLGTVITISSYEPLDRKVLDRAFATVTEIEERMSVNLSHSEISAINGGGTEPVEVSEETRALIARAIEFSELSGGAFDISIGSVMQLWKRDGEFAVLPTHEDIRIALRLVDSGQIVLSDHAVLTPAGMQLDLGGIAKGYACDKTLEYLKSVGIVGALLDFGGNIYAHGLKPDGTPWVIAVASPVVGDDGLVCVIPVSDTAVVTSGGYERYFEADGTMYHHILDPRTGYPVDNELLSVTIIDASSTRADALSTACFVLGLDAGLALLESMPSSEGVFITKDFTIHTTSELRGEVVIMDSRYSLAT